VRKWLKYFLLLLISNSGFAQKLEPFFQYQHYTVKDGLVSNFVKDAIQDKKGFLWLATNQGLVRFDGTHFKTISKKFPDSLSISDNPLNKLNIIDNNLWVTGFGGVVKMNLETYKFKTYVNGFNLNEQISLNETFCVFRDSKKNIWLGTAGSGLFKLNNNEDKFELVKPPRDLHLETYNWITTIIEMKNGALLFPDTRGLIEFKNENSVLLYKYPNLKKNTDKYRISGIYNFAVSLEKIWTNMDEFGLYLFNRDTKRWKSVTKDDVHKKEIGNSNFLIQKINEQLNAGSNKQYVIDSKTGELTISQTSTKPISSCYNIYESADQNLWYCTETGLFKLSNNNTSIESVIEIPTWKAKNIIYDSAYNCLYGTNVYLSNKIEKYNLSTKFISPASNVFNSKLIRVVKEFVNLNGNFYISSFNGLWQLNNEQQIPKPITNPTTLANLYTTGSIKTYKDYIIVSGIPKGPLVYNTTNNSYELLSKNDTFSAIHNEIANAVHVNNNGVIYYAKPHIDTVYKCTTDGRCIEKIALQRAATVNKFKEHIAYITADRLNNIWVAYLGNGLYKYDAQAKQWQHLFNKDNFNSINCELLLYDNLNTVWYTSTEGLFNIDITTNAVQKIDEKLDMSATSYPFNLAVFTAGKIIAHNYNGKLYILNNNKSPNKNKPAIFIENLNIMGSESEQNIEYTNQIILQPKQNAFSIEFGAIYITNAELINYSVMLEGINENWLNLGNRKNINYAGLKPGKYKLKIKATSPSNSFTTNERIIELIVKPIWYQTLLFKILAILLSALAVFGFIRAYYANQLLKQKNETEKQFALMQERNRIAEDMHDDLGAGLSQIRFLSNEATTKTEDKELKIILENTKINSDGLVDKMNDIIWSLNNQDQNLEDLITYMRSQFGTLIESVGLKFTMEVQEPMQNILLNNEKKRNIYLVCKEAIHNTIKHAKASIITLHIEQISNILQIKVSDNGEGFSVENKKVMGNGISNYHKRMAVLGGQVIINSSTNGTIVDFKIPI
jgi:signal transduction histidine kinase/ligand-binding sensor domain-containing protein